MYFRIIRNDFLRSKLVTLTTTIFVAAAAMLVSLAAILIIHLSGAIDTLMTQSKTPHFMQMHSGELNIARLSAFAEQNSHVDQFQVVDFLNVEGSRIVINGSSLTGSVQDNGFATQNEGFDYLLDLDGNVIQPSDGEVYVPVAYKKDGTAKLGDQIVVGETSFTVAGFHRDSQMNSLLAASKRFLVNQQGYAAVQGLGSTEYLIEFRLKDMSAIGEFESQYISAGLEANGPTLTYAHIKILNAISDGMMIAVLLLVSALVVTISFMCIRFTLLAKIEEDYREIGVMKAIGLRVSDMKRLYLAKYTAIGVTGCMLGWAMSLLFQDLLLVNIRLYMGIGEHGALAVLFGLIGVGLIFAAILAYVNRVLKRFRHISAAEAVRFGASQDRAAGAKRFSLSRNRLLNTNIFLGIKDVLSRKRLYATMLAVLVLSAFIMIVPRNIYTTISGEGFSMYMGVGESDFRMDIQQTVNITGKAADIAAVMASDSTISSYAVFTTKTFQMKTDEGTEKRLLLELGDHSVFPLQYGKGRAPVAEDELALSVLNASELGKKVGDTLILTVSGKEKPFTVSGIYSDVTNGGKTAKAAFTDDSAEVMWSIIYAKLTDAGRLADKISEYESRFSYAKVTDADEFIAQIFGPTISSVGKVSYGALGIALMISVLVTLLFMNMLIAKDRYSIAVMKAFGFTNRDLSLQYASRSMFVLIIGIVLGTLLANTVGELLAGMVIAQFGASTFTFSVNPLTAYVLIPLMLVCSVLAATLISTSGAGRIKLSDHIKE